MTRGRRGTRNRMRSTPARERAIRRFRQLAGTEPTVVARAPGRVNLIGEHTDYNDGFVLPAAVDVDLVVCGRARSDGMIRITSADARIDVRFPVGGPSRARWAQYVAGVAALLAEAVGARGGAELVLASDVPSGVGLSSSAALEVATARALLQLANAELPIRDIVALCRRAELEWAGVHCGVMDQAVVAMGRAGHGLLLDCRSLHVEPVPIPDSAALLVVDSGADRSLAGSAYNDRVRECAEAAALLGVANLRDAAGSAIESATLPELLMRRARHVVTENARTLAFANALRTGDLVTCGALMNASHASLRDDYEVSSPALDRLMQAAVETNGVHGAKLTGAGFGGCVVVLTAADQAAAVRESLLSRTRARSVHRFRPADGATIC